MSASAIGLAFSVPATVDVISVTAKWGRYERSPSETHETPTGRAAITWHQVPAGRVCRGADRRRGIGLARAGRRAAGRGRPVHGARPKGSALVELALVNW